MSDSEHGRPLLTPDEVRRLPRDEAIVIVGNKRPLLLKKLYYNEEPCEAEASICPFPRALSYEPQKRVGHKKGIFLLPPPEFPRELEEA